MVSSFETLKQGIHYQQQGERELALECYRQIPEQDDLFPDAQHLTGVLAFQEGDFEKAKTYMGRALQHKADNTVFCADYGLVMERLQQYPDAIRYYQKALRIDPKNQEWYNRLANLYTQLGQFVPLLKVYKKVIHHFPSFTDIYLNIGTVYIKLNRPDKARKWFERYLTQNPDHIAVRFELAKILMGEDQLDLAMEHFLEILKRDPKHLKALNELTFCLCFLGDPKRAHAFAQMAMATDEINLDSWMNSMYLDMALFSDDTERIIGTVPDPSSETTYDIVLVSGATLGSSGGGQNPEQMAREFQRMGHRVVHYEPISEIPPEGDLAFCKDYFMLSILKPREYTKNRLRKILQSFTRSSETNRVVVFNIFSPYLLGLADVFQEFGYRILYYCLDDWDAMQWPKVPAGTEAAMARRADAVLAISDILIEKLQDYCGKPVTKLPNGFSRRNFPTLTEKPPVPEDMVFGKTKTLVYWGNLSDSWIDWDLLATVARRNPDWSFNMIGRLKEEESEHCEAPNIHYLGGKKVQELQAYGCYAEIAFIHFKDNDLIRAVSPIKGYEYLAAGLPIISSPMPELNDFPYTLQIKDAEGFEQAVRTIETWRIDPEVIEKFLSESTWEQRARTMMDVMVSTRNLPGD